MHPVSCIYSLKIYVWQLVSAALSLAQFFLQILRLEKKPWRKTGQSRDKAASLEKGDGKRGLEKGQCIQGGAIRKPSLDMKEEELSQAQLAFVKPESFTNLTL